MKIVPTVDNKVEEVASYLRNCLSYYAERYPEKYDIIAYRFVQQAEILSISAPETAKKILAIASTRQQSYDIVIDNILTTRTPDDIAKILMP